LLLGLSVMESAIDRFFAALPDQKRALTLYLRDIITEVHPKTVERIKWKQHRFRLQFRNRILY